MQLIISPILLVLLIMLFFFLRTSFTGLRYGDNEQMVRGTGASTDYTKLAGLLTNGLVALLRALVPSAIFADIQWVLAW